MNRYFLPAIACMVMHYTPVQAGVFEQDGDTVMQSLVTSDVNYTCERKGKQRACASEGLTGMRVGVMEKNGSVTMVLGTFEGETAAGRAMIGNMLTLAATEVTDSASEVPTQVSRLREDMLAKLKAGDSTQAVVERAGMKIVIKVENRLTYFAVLSTNQ